MKKILFSLFNILCWASLAMAGTVTGQIQTPSTGRGVPNGTLTFTLSQAAVVSGTATLAGNANCWTDTNGNVAGLPGDAAVAAPVLSSNLGSGSLGAGTYYVRYTWANATGESQPSAERSLALTSSGTLVVQSPASVPGAATSMKIYIGTASGGETLQGSVAVTNGILAGNYNQATGLAAGAALPSSNTSVCQIRFNDELQPSYTGYVVTLTNLNGGSVAGFPQKWYLSGGSNGTVNVGVGLPLYSGVVVYPQPIVSNPAANGMQSVNGPLNMNGFAILNTVITNPNGAVVLPEIAPPSGVAGSDVLYADSAAHRFKMINNNGAADVVMGASTTDVLANKTLDTASGNTIKINGNTLSSVTGSGAVVLATSPQLTAPNIGSSSGNTHTFVNQTAPANPPAGSITIYGDSGSGNLACRNNTGNSCLFASAAPPLISTSANPAGTGVVRIASGDTAFAFRNNANSGDVGVTKNSSDVMDLTAFNGVKLQTLQITAPNGFFASCGGGAFIYNDASNPNSMNLCFGDGTGWKLNFSKRSGGLSNSVANLSDSGVFTTSVFQTAGNNPASSGVFRCAGNQACAVARTPDNTSDVQLGYAMNGPLAVFGSIGGSTSGVTAEVGELKVDTGVTVQSTGFKHFRLASGTSCTTPGAQGSQCTTGLISLPGPAFPDTNYTLVCVPDGPATGSPVIQGVGGKNPSSFTLAVLQVGTAASSYGAADCIAIHD